MRGNLFPLDKKFSPLPITLLLDTGAARTAITRNILMGLGYTQMTKSKTPTMTATGLVYFDMVKIAKLELGGEFAFADVNVHVLEWKNSHLHGVIGMDILSRLHIHSDTVNFVIQSNPFKLQSN